MTRLRASNCLKLLALWANTSHQQVSSPVTYNDSDCMDLMYHWHTAGPSQCNLSRAGVIVSVAYNNCKKSAGSLFSALVIYFFQIIFFRYVWLSKYYKQT